MLKNTLKQFFPSSFLAFYHRAKALLAARFYRFPSRRFVVVGVTGTKGKSSTANFIWAALRAAGVHTSLFTTANIRIGDEERLNPYHMTMPSPFVLQKFLADAARASSEVAIVETTSQGIVQYRHLGIAYDMLIFTNLTAEHIEAHGSFEAYRAAKQIVFKELMNQPRKEFRGRPVPKAIFVNIDSPEAEHFLRFPADVRRTFGVSMGAELRATSIRETEGGVAFAFKGMDIELRVPGRVNVLNSLPAFAVGDALGLPVTAVAKGLEGLPGIPGRFEIVARDPFAVVVDYAHEPVSLSSLLMTVRAAFAQARIIVVFGATGGGRDRVKRPEMGRVAASYAETLIITNDDPFDEPPSAIIEAVAEGARRAGKRDAVNLFTIEDRREAIKKAFSAAREGDAVVIAGKGSEQSLIIGSRKIPWDDRRVAREELEKLGSVRNSNK